MKLLRSYVRCLLCETRDKWYGLGKGLGQSVYLRHEPKPRTQDFSADSMLATKWEEMSTGERKDFLDYFWQAVVAILKKSIEGDPAIFMVGRSWGELQTELYGQDGRNFRDELKRWNG